MPIRRETRLWLERADYDLDTAAAMLRSARYLYVAFACQQAIEKYLKAIIQEQTGTHPPYTHNLALLAETAGVSFDDDRRAFLIVLTQYYLNARYVDFKQRLFEGMNRAKAKECLRETREIVRCLKKELKI